MNDTVVWPWSTWCSWLEVNLMFIHELMSLTLDGQSLFYCQHKPPALSSWFWTYSCYLTNSKVIVTKVIKAHLQRSCKHILIIPRECRFMTRTWLTAALQPGCKHLVLSGLHYRWWVPCIFECRSALLAPVSVCQLGDSWVRGGF